MRNNYNFNKMNGKQNPYMKTINERIAEDIYNKYKDVFSVMNSDTGKSALVGDITKALDNKDLRIVDFIKATANKIKITDNRIKVLENKIKLL